MSIATAIVDKLQQWFIIPKRTSTIYREAEEVVASEAVRADIRNQLLNGNRPQDASVGDVILERHVRPSEAYQNQPTSFAQKQMELHARLAVFHVMVRSLPENVPDKELMVDKFENKDAIKPLDIDNAAFGQPDTASA